MLKKLIIFAVVILLIGGCAMAAGNLWSSGSAAILPPTKEDRGDVDLGGNTDGDAGAGKETVTVICPYCSYLHKDVIADVECECGSLYYVYEEMLWYCENCGAECEYEDNVDGEYSCWNCNFFTNYCEDHMCWYDDTCSDCEEAGSEVSYGEQFKEGYMANGQSGEIWQAIYDGIEEGDGSEYEGYFEYDAEETVCGDCFETIYYYYNSCSNISDVFCDCGYTLHEADDG